MKLYHLAAPNDAAGERVLHTLEGRVREAGGYLHLSRSYGIDDAILVIVLPDDLNPAELDGLEEAQWRADLPDLPTPPSTGTPSVE